MENGIYAKFNTAKGSVLVKLEHEFNRNCWYFVGLAEGNLENVKATRDKVL
jgi:peptidyl-prolyl cis-trans isomerase A (cyclophilin A)